MILAFAQEPRARSRCSPAPRKHVVGCQAYVEVLGRRLNLEMVSELRQLGKLGKQLPTGSPLPSLSMRHDVGDGPAMHREHHSLAVLHGADDTCCVITQLSH